MMLKGVGQFLQMSQDKLQEERDKEQRARNKEKTFSDGGIPGFGGVTDNDSRIRDRSVERDRPDNNWNQVQDEEV